MCIPNLWCQSSQIYLESKFNYTLFSAEFVCRILLNSCEVPFIRAMRTAVVVVVTEHGNNFRRKVVKVIQPKPLALTIRF